MVTQDGNHAVSVIVGVELLLHSAFVRCTLIELLLEGVGRVEGTEHLGGETFHEAREMLVQVCSLWQKQYVKCILWGDMTINLRQLGRTAGRLPTSGL